MDTAKTEQLHATEVQDPTSFKKPVSFTVGELIYPEGLEATFRVTHVGDSAMRIYRISQKVIVPKEPFRVRFKCVLFRVGFWNKSLPREFTIHHTNE
jgi:hypothetical protein